MSGQRQIAFFGEGAIGRSTSTSLQCLYQRTTICRVFAWCSLKRAARRADVGDLHECLNGKAATHLFFSSIARNLRRVTRPRPFDCLPERDSWTEMAAGLALAKRSRDDAARCRRSSAMSSHSGTAA